MKQWVADKLICPECRKKAVPLKLKINEAVSDDVVSGQLSCPECHSHYPIERGIAIVLPQKTRNIINEKNGYNAPQMLSAYLWSHFADLFNDPKAGDAYKVWSESLQFAAGDSALDVGCSVGRLSFELAKTHDKVIGIDTSFAFIQKARKIVRQKSLDFEMIVEGHLTEPCHYQFDSTYNFDGIDFIVADALALPFNEQDFATVAAINILEKVPEPLDHLKEVNRVLQAESATFLFSDPFSWDEKISPPECWLGGNGSAHFSPRGIDTIHRIFSGEFGIFTPPFSIKTKGDVSWKIRKTENLWEYITSQFLVGHRQ